MSQSATASASLVRVSVSSGTRRADLGVPAGVPAVEIIPELARELGVLDPAGASHGFRLVAGGGTVVDPDRSFAAQGISDGAMLVLDAFDGSAEKVYDDVVEAVADIVETQFAPWTARHSAGTAVGAAAVFLLCSAWALFTARDAGPIVAAVAGLVALLLVAAAAVLQSRDQHTGAVILAATALVWSAVAGTAIQPAAQLWGEGLLWIGAAIAITGLLGALAVPRHRLILAAGSVLGAIAAALGVSSGLLDVPMTVACALTYLVAVVVGNVLPWLGVTSTRLTGHPPRTEAEIARDIPRIDQEQVRAHVARGHEVMVAVAFASGGAALLATPQVVAAGAAGAALVVTGAVATLLRTRHTRTRVAVSLAMGSGTVTIAVAAVVAAQTHPAWRAGLAVLLAGTAAVVVTLAVLLPRTRVRMGRAADILDGASLVALVPLAAAATGVV